MSLHGDFPENCENVVLYRMRPGNSLRDPVVARSLFRENCNWKACCNLAAITAVTGSRGFALCDGVRDRHLIFCCTNCFVKSLRECGSTASELGLQSSLGYAQLSSCISY